MKNNEGLGWPMVVVVLVLVAAVAGWLGYQRGQTTATETAAVNASDQIIASQVQTAVSLLEAIEMRREAGKYTSAQAKALGEDLLRDLRYGDDKEGYFWADTVEGVNVVLYGREDVEGKNRYGAVENGVPYIKQIIEKAKQGGGYTDYYFPKKDETESKAKRAYSLLFEPFGWVVGTGYYLEDVR